MKPLLDRLVVVTASINPERAAPCFQSWEGHAHYRLHTIVVWNGALDTSGMPASEAKLYKAFAPEFDRQYPGTTFLVRPEILGVVPAFALGVAAALRMGAEIVACIHDDVEILEDDWDLQVLSRFDTRLSCGLAGFGGGKGLGAENIYQVPYQAHQLARTDFISNMVDAEQHGRRVTVSERVACLDGFSLIGRADFWNGVGPKGNLGDATLDKMVDSGLVHHYYDGLAATYAAKLGWEVWMLPVSVRHLGGQTAVGEPRYAEWAKTIVPKGDEDFWEMAHAIGYEEGRGILPIRT